MFTRFALSALLASSLIPLISADPVPTAPGPGDVFKEGGDCTFTWTPDTTGVWKVMNVELMTGSNLGMIHLDTVATLDGTSTTDTTFTYTCPAVIPNSAIYFYQFSSPASPNRTWTTRFTIADPTGATTPPTEATQPGTNAPIPWGTGALQDPSKARPAPVGGGGSGNGTATTNSTTATASSLSQPPATMSSTPTGAPLTTSAGSSSAAPSPTATNAATPGLAAAAGTRALKALVAVGGAAVAFVVFL